MRILLHTSRVLYPADTGGKIRSSKLFERLSRRHEITIVCFRREDEPEENLDLMRRSCVRLETLPWKETQRNTPRFYLNVARNVLSSYPFSVEKYYDPRMEDLIRRLAEQEPYDLLLCDSVVPSRNVLFQPLRPRVVFEHNLESMIPKRQFERADNPIAKTFFFLQWLKFSHYYRQCAAKCFDHFVMVSENDRRMMRELHGISCASSIPTGVDVQYFRPSRPEAEENNLVFTGSMDWLPNVDGLEFFVSRILPRVQQQMDVKLWIVGRNPPPHVQAWTRERSGVVVTGWVEDVRPYVEMAKLYVVPLRVGGGTRIKIFEAMAMGKAVVSTRVGAEGLPVADGTNIALADEPNDFAELIVRLLRDAGRRRALGKAARQFVSAGYSWDAAAQRLGEICEMVGAPVGRAAARVA